MSTSHLHACETCGLIQTVPALARDQVAHCGRCGGSLPIHDADSPRRAFARALAATLLAIPAFTMPVMEMNMSGVTMRYGVVDAGLALWNSEIWILGPVVLLAAVAFPLLTIAGIFQLLALRQAGVSGAARRGALRRLRFYRNWTVADVFIAAAVVAIVKISDLIPVQPTWGLLAYGLMAVYTVMALRNIHAHQMFEDLPVAAGPPPGADARDCPVCELVQAPADSCRRCGAALHAIKPDSARRALALGLAALIFFIPANTFPVMTMVIMGKASATTIFDSVALLWNENAIPLALLVLTASIIVPLVKILILLALLASLRFRRQRYRRRTRGFHFIELIGKWSMLDIYVVALMTAMITQGNLASAVPDIGALYFCVVVILTLLATQSFDPRLIWRNWDERVQDN